MRNILKEKRLCELWDELLTFNPTEENIKDVFTDVDFLRDKAWNWLLKNKCSNELLINIAEWFGMYTVEAVYELLRRDITYEECLNLIYRIDDAGGGEYDNQVIIIWNYFIEKYHSKVLKDDILDIIGVVDCLNEKAGGYLLTMSPTNIELEIIITHCSSLKERATNLYKPQYTETTCIDKIINKMYELT